MAYPENTAEGGDAGEFADEGTAAHTLASDCLKTKTDAEDHLGRKIKVGKREFEVTDEFAGHVQTYVDDVRRRAMGGYLMVEQRVTLDGVEGFDHTNYGTSDAIIAISKPGFPSSPYGVVEDLKFGQGERVYAWIRATEKSLFTFEAYMNDEDDAGTLIEPNYQLMMYALAARADIEMLVGDIKGILIVINQPRVGSLTELWVPVAVLDRFALFVADAYTKAQLAMGLGVKAVKADLKKWYSAGEKQCRWCKAVTDCPAADKFMAEEAGADFEVVAQDQAPPPVPMDLKRLARAMAAVPFIENWCNEVMITAARLIGEGAQIIGPDKKPYKFVEGKQGKRVWTDVKKAEGMLVGQLGEDAYTKKLLTAPAAGKILNKKKTKKLWEDAFEPLIKRADGKPMLVLGSDPRPSYAPTSSADEFETEDDE